MKNIESITLLDCTLRDGGHLTDGVFGEQMIKTTIKSLTEAKIDIIEVGFLTEESYGTDTARFRTIADVKKVLPEEKGTSRYSLMADNIDVSGLEPCDGTIEFIRLSFKRQRLEWGLNAAKILMEKGYKCFINPVNCNVYTDEEYLQVIRKVNELHPYGFSIVDTFGVLRKKDLSRLYYLVEHNLHPDICLGVHLHENMGMSFLLAQHFIEIHAPGRKINIDGSLLGMGRAPGNLCIEQMMDYMNEQYGGEYVMEPALDTISDYIAPLKEEKKWGYSIPYALSAKYKLHRTYAEYLMSKWKLNMKDIQRILSEIDRSEAEYFNEDYIEHLYEKYVGVVIDDSEAMKRLKEAFSGKEILLIAPGSSIESYKEQICEKAQNACTMSIGFAPDFCDVDYIWFTSIKRYKQFDFAAASPEVIITSNIMRDAKRYDLVVDFNNLVCHDEVPYDNSTLLALHLLKKTGASKVYIAGFDGFNSERSNFYGGMFNRQNTKEDVNQKVSSILKKSYRSMELEFITPTRYEYE